MQSYLLPAFLINNEVQNSDCLHLSEHVLTSLFSKLLTISFDTGGVCFFTMLWKPAGQAREIVIDYLIAFLDNVVY